MWYTKLIVFSKRGNAVLNINIDGLNINYICEGSGDDVVLLHGWGSNINLFAGIVNTLGPHYRVIAPDMPGFGESDEPKEAWCVDDYVDFVIKFLQKFGIKKAVFLGHSFGGRVIIKMFARRNLPFEITKVILADSAGVLQQLRAGRFELGFAGAQEQSPELVFLPFFRDRMVLITPNTPHFAKLLQDGTPVKSILEREPLLLREAGSGSQKCADAFLEEEGLSQRTLHVAARLEDQQSIKNLVAAGLGVSIISGKAAQDDCVSGRLLSIPLPTNRAGRSLYLVWRKNGALRQQTLGFIEFVRNFYTEQQN